MSLDEDVVRIVGFRDRRCDPTDLFIDDDRDGCRLHVEQLEGSEPEHRAFDFAEVDDQFAFFALEAVI